MNPVIIPTNPEAYGNRSEAEIEVIQCRVQHVCDALEIPCEEQWDLAWSADGWHPNQDLILTACANGIPLWINSTAFIVAFKNARAAYPFPSAE